jgi:cytochrome d ubiquinol oxidase subunit I
MDPLFLARWQFAITTIFHFFFVPVTLGMTIFIAICETVYVRTGQEVYKKLAKFWGKLFLISFGLGVVSGILQEFQFGMNWSEYSRFMGDIFGAPLAIEALAAFFLESVFIGVWIFGWDKLSKRAHAVTAWLVALGTNLSALWILVANSFMHEPVGYRMSEDGSKVLMSDFSALLTNPHVWVQFPHVITSAIATAGFFVMGVSAWHMLRKTQDLDPFRRSFKIAAVYGGIGLVLAMLVGHNQAQHMVEAQPMKMAAAENLRETEASASLSLFAIDDIAFFFESDPEELKKMLDTDPTVEIRLPGALSFLAHNDFDTPVQGVLDVQEDYEERFGAGQSYVPPIPITYWSFRIMIGAGVLMLGLLVWVVFRRGKLEQSPLLLKLLIWGIALPFIANTTGWIFTEVGRMPWIVFGLQRVEDGVSVAVSAGEVAFSLFAFTAMYVIVTGAGFYLMRKHARAGITGLEASEVPGLSPEPRPSE